MKRRARWKPIALIAADLKQVKKFFFMSKNEERLAKKYWPAFGSEAQARRGGLTILLKPKTPSSPNPSSGRRGEYIAWRALSPTPLVSPLKRGGKKLGERPLRIGVRVPAHAGARRLAARAAAPITATSANLSGQTPTKSARKVKRDFPDILMVPGQCGSARRPSTVVELKQNKIYVIRPGAINLQ